MTNAFSETPPPTQSVVIVEDQTSTRELLAEFVANMPGFKVVGQAGTVEEALDLVVRLKPKVMILDWMLWERTGNEVLQKLPVENRPHVLVCSGETSDQVVREAMVAGATGFIEKTARFEQFTDALRTVASGNTYASSTVAGAMRRLVTAPAPSQISERERDVLKLVAEGHSSREIAGQLGLSLRTVENHRANISRRTGIRSVAQFTRLAARLGLIATSAPVLGHPNGAAPWGA